MEQSIFIIGEPRGASRASLLDRLRLHYPVAEPVFLTEGERPSLFSWKHLRGMNKAVRFLFLDNHQYLNPNVTKDHSQWLYKLMLLLMGKPCLKGTVHNYSQEEAAHMDGYEMQSASWSRSRREKSWHIHEEHLWSLVRNAFKAKSRRLLKVYYTTLHRVVFRALGLAFAGRRLRVLSGKERVRPFMERYVNRVGFVLNDFLVHTLLKQNEPFIQRPTLEIGIANGEAPTLMHGDRILDAGVEFLPFWPIWGKPKGNFRNFQDRILSADATHLPFQEESFRTILMVNVLSHCMYLDQTLQELHRALKPGGHLIVNMMTDDSWKYTYFLPTLARRFGAKRLLRLLEKLYNPLCRKNLINSKVNLKYHLKSEEEWREAFSSHGFSTTQTIRYDADTYWVTRLFHYKLIEPMINLGYKFDIDLPADDAANLYAAMADRELENIVGQKGEGNTILFLLTKEPDERTGRI